jgi:tetratricopeptide (TPR) repeat protein
LSEALYERYKDALRRGHLAMLRGRHDAALAAYFEAATIAPERALPHTSIGTVSLRIGRPADALTAFDHALDRAPGDEGALLGRADALVALGRPSEAAEALDRLAVAQESAGRPVDALDSARRALELAESRSRRNAVASLVERLRETGDDAPGQAALARAVHLLERTSVALPQLDDEAAAGAGSGQPVISEAGADGAGPTVPEPETAPAGPEPETDPRRFLEEAEATLDSGDAALARAGLLRAAILLDRAGLSDAALDACYEALALAPDDPDLHLALADLYLDRGWRLLAADKLRLLGRLADLAGDDETGRRVRDVARHRLADEALVRELLG